MRLLAMLILAAVPLFAASAFGAPRAQTPQHASYLPLLIWPPYYRIAFSSQQNGKATIYVMNADGSNQTYLAEGTNPDWSPDGRQIVFDGVDVINADGFNRIYLQSGGDPDWSPDGSHIVFMSAGQILKMHADGSNVIEIIKRRNDNIGGPAWSPDGRWIAFVWGENLYYYGYDVCVKLATGLGSTHCLSRTLSDGDDEYPTWSPDGQWLAFSSSYPFYENSIYMVHPDGTNLTRVATGHGPPSWSPDGRRIAFEWRGDIYAINVDGSGLTNLTMNPDDDTNPAWAPDGQRIAFVSRRDGNAEIYVMNADGSSQTRLTNNPADDTEPLWSPRIN